MCGSIDARMERRGAKRGIPCSISRARPLLHKYKQERGLLEQPWRSRA